MALSRASEKRKHERKKLVKILLLGAGAVGGYFGGRLAEAGVDVTFLVRPKRAALLAKTGLRISSGAGDVALQPKCVVAEEVKPDYDIVMFTAKAYDLASAVRCQFAEFGVFGRALHRGANLLGLLAICRLGGPESAHGMPSRIVVSERAEPERLAGLAMNAGHA